MVDGETALFTRLLLNFYAPTGFLPTTDSSEPLSVFPFSPSVFSFFPLPSTLPHGAFRLLIPPCHELTTFLLSCCVFSCRTIFLLYLFLLCSLVARRLSGHHVKPIRSPVWLHSSLSSLLPRSTLWPPFNHTLLSAYPFSPTSYPNFLFFATFSVHLSVRAFDVHFLPPPLHCSRHATAFQVRDISRFSAKGHYRALEKILKEETRK